MTQQIQIKLSKKELKEILCKKFDLQSSTAKLEINKLQGNQFEPECMEITITADRTRQTELNNMYYEK